MYMSFKKISSTNLKLCKLSRTHCCEVKLGVVMWSAGWHTTCYHTMLITFRYGHDTITVTKIASQRRHGVSNLQQREWLFNRLPKCSSKTVSYRRVTGILWTKSTGHQWIPLAKGEWRGKCVYQNVYIYIYIYEYMCVFCCVDKDTTLKKPRVL